MKAVSIVAITFLLILPIYTHAQKAPSYCFQLNLDLKYKPGNQTGDPEIKKQVIQLQNFLRVEGFLQSSSTGYFGPRTVAAVKKFQIKYNISPTGIVGPKTRAKIHTLVGCGREDIITSVKGPDSLNVNEQGTWTLTAKIFDKKIPKYQILWNYLGYMGAMCDSCRNIYDYGSLSTSTFTFTHVYDRPGAYVIRFGVMNEYDIWSFKDLAVIVGTKTFDVPQDKFSFEYPKDYLVKGPHGIAVHDFTIYKDEKVDARSRSIASSFVRVLFADKDFDIDKYLVETMNVDKSKVRSEKIGDNYWLVMDVVSWNITGADSKTYVLVRKNEDGTVIYEITGTTQARDVTSGIVKTFKSTY